MRVPWADRLWLIVWLYLTAGYTMASKEQVILAATKIISVTESDINARNILLNALIGGAKSIVESDVVLTLPTGERIGPFPLPVVHEAIESVIVKGKDSKEKT